MIKKSDIVVTHVTRIVGGAFEFKYLVVLIFMGVLYFLVHALYLGLNVLEDLYDSGRRMYKNIEEKTLNMQLAVEQSYQQKPLPKCCAIRLPLHQR